MKTTPLLILTIFLFSCTTKIDMTTPKPYNVDKSKVYNLKYDTVWHRTVAWFATKNVSIDKIQKDSGLITAKYKLLDNANTLDCGELEYSFTVGTPTVDKIGSLNVLVTKIKNDSTRVTVNYFGEYLIKGYEGWNGFPISKKGDCVSTGELETSLLDFIEAN